MCAPFRSVSPLRNVSPLYSVSLLYVSPFTSLLSRRCVESLSLCLPSPLLKLVT